MKRRYLFLGAFFFLLNFASWFFPKVVFGNQATVCPDRYLTLINPVRGRDRWYDKTLNPIKEQYQLVKNKNLAATWLLQADVLQDSSLMGVIKGFDSKQELGVFLEVSQNLADAAKVIYPYDAAWFSPRAIFLSGYAQSDRIKLIDKVFSNFKEKFGYFPKTVGAWWIDSYSLDYLVKKYQVKAVLISADQLSTDNYGVWGQWWGVPYYPAKSNILVPANSLESKQSVVVVQWAERDPIRAYGDSPRFSNYSLQANDYVRQGENTDYFKELVNVYLSCINKLGQITVGLETGIESVAYLDEYRHQLDFLTTVPGLKDVTLSQLADNFAQVYPDFPKKVVLDYQESQWVLTPEERINNRLGDRIIYQSNLSFPDYFLADRSDFLNRRLTDLPAHNNLNRFPWYILVILGLMILAISKRMLDVWLVSVMFVFGAFGLVLRSYSSSGWYVFYGPRVKSLEFTQVVLVISCFYLIWWLKKLKQPIWFIPIFFGINFILEKVRFSFISGKYLLGIMTDNLHLVGFSYLKPVSIGLVNKDLPGYQAAAMLRVNFAKFWSNPGLMLTIYPMIYILVSILVYWLISKLPGKIRLVVVLIFIALYLGELIQINKADPLFVLPT